MLKCTWHEELEEERAGTFGVDGIRHQLEPLVLESQCAVERREDEMEGFAGGRTRIKRRR